MYGRGGADHSRNRLGPCSQERTRAQLIFQRAIETALKVEALNVAGLAALTLIEEIDHLSPAILQAAYHQALNGSQILRVKMFCGD